jgi:hypothetical protein
MSTENEIHHAGKEIDVSEDGGVMKEILVDGDGQKKTQQGE